MDNFGYNNSPYIWMDPRSKGIVFFAANFAIWGSKHWVVGSLFFTFIIFLLLNGKQIKMAVITFCIYFVFLFADVRFSPEMSGTLSIIMLTLLRVTRLYMPIMLTAVLLIRTTTVSEFVAAFTRMKVSEKIIIPFSVMFRFFPTIGEEWRNIRNAMKFRGIQFGWKAILLSPIQTLEYVIVPLLMSTVKISGELSAASISRGLGGSAKRTCYKKIRFGLLDYIVVIVSIAYVAFTMLSRV